MISNIIFSQKESANWYFGAGAGLDFNSGSPAPLTDGRLVTREGCATISDSNGSLLFYTDGITVWDKQHNVMLNGTGLLGNISSTESAIIIPKPGNKNIYYIFTVDEPDYLIKENDLLTQNNTIDGVNYSKVDMTLNNGLGDIVEDEKNIHLVTYDKNNPQESEYKCSEKITAVTSGDGSSIWVISQFTNKFYAFLVDDTGVNHQPVISTVQQNIPPLINDVKANVSAVGYLKVSPNGKKLAIAHSFTALGKDLKENKRSGKVLLYDFNNSNGVVSNTGKTILSNECPYGVEFSPNSKLLYVTSSLLDTNSNLVVDGYLYQYNLEVSDIPSSKKIINKSKNVAGALQLAIDGKIYKAGYLTGNNSSGQISVINNPNNLGTSCNYSHNSIELNGKAAHIGLPPFIQSIFLYSFDYEFTCLGDSTHFFITSLDPYDNLEWDFGDGTTSNQSDTYHTYQNPGTYTVSLNLSINGVDYDPFIKQVIITETPKILTSTYELVQCDSYDNNQNDGITTFYLEDANAPISLYTNQDIVVYY